MHYADLRLHVALGGTCTLFPDLLLESSFKASISFPPPTHTHTHTHTHTDTNVNKIPAFESTITLLPSWK